MTDSIEQFVAAVTPPKRRRDAQTLLGLYAQATGQQPRLWGSLIGYGEYHYRYDSGREGDAPAAAFAPRKAATSVYLMDGIVPHTARLERLGPHRTGVGCLYLTDLSANDLSVLAEIVAASYKALTAGTFTQRARGGG